LESFSNIFGNGSYAGDPNFNFAGQHTKDGLVLTPNGSGLTQAGTARSFAFSGINRRGLNEQIRISYLVETGGSYSPAKFEYDYFTDGVQFLNSVTFNRSSRVSRGETLFDPDGTLVEQNTVIERISVTTGGAASPNLMREYRLAYDNSSGVPLLTSVTECGRDGTCKLPITITYQRGSRTFGEPIQSDVLDIGQEFGRAWVDANGDGKADFCRVIGATGTTRAVCTLSSGTGFGATISSQVLDAGLEDDSRTWADINGDGKVDFCRKIAGGTQLACTYSNGDGFGARVIASALTTSSTMKPFAWVDADNDGRQDFCQLQSSAQIQCALASGTGFTVKSYTLNFQPVSNQYASDAEFVTTPGQGLEYFCHRSEPTNNGPQISCDSLIDRKLASSTVIEWGNSDGRKWADLNGDGLADFCYASNSLENGSLYSPGIACFLFSAGVNYGTQYMRWRAMNIGLPGSAKWVDVDGDKRIDFCRVIGSVGSRQLVCSTAKGTTFGDDITSQVQDVGLDKKGWGWADFKGTGALSYCRLIGTASGIDTRAVCTPFNATPIVATRFADGSGATYTVDYLPLTDPTVHTRENDAVYPQRDFAEPLYVVSKVTRNDGSGNTISSNYTYGGMKKDLTGRDLLGFRWIEIAQPELQMGTRTEYRQDFPFNGLPTKTTKKNSTTGSVLSLATFNYGCTDFVSPVGCSLAPGRRYFPYLSDSVTSKWDLNGDAFPTTTTTYQYDSFGSVTKSIVTRSDGTSETVDTVYMNDESNWFIGRPTKVTVTKSKQ
jgi:hypothetical protein